LETVNLFQDKKIKNQTIDSGGNLYRQAGILSVENRTINCNKIFKLKYDKKSPAKTDN
jgi:hypothetical protein